MVPTLIIVCRHLLEFMRPMRQDFTILPVLPRTTRLLNSATSPSSLGPRPIRERTLGNSCITSSYGHSSGWPNTSPPPAILPVLPRTIRLRNSETSPSSLRPRSIRKRTNTKQLHPQQQMAQQYDPAAPNPAGPYSHVMHPSQCSQIDIDSNDSTWLGNSTPSPSSLRPPLHPQAHAQQQLAYQQQQMAQQHAVAQFQQQQQMAQQYAAQQQQQQYAAAGYSNQMQPPAGTRRFFE
ncbi:hypothetical protein B0H14DRAFT_3502002 [Mycena olivaceomarginata]|nr:hypothetical protein B0H14DRAFT_3502002 [Mycena olivaceomarginata]